MTGTDRPARDNARAPAVFHNITALRAVAALLVVALHLRPLLGRGDLPVIGVQTGRAGVDLFFIISGFVIAYSAAAERPTAGQFLLKRLIRVVPLYWALTLTLFLASRLAPGFLHSFQFRGSDLARSLLFVPYLNSDGAPLPIISVGWTLSFEMLFYGLFAFGLLALRGRVWASAISVASVLIGLMVVGGFGAASGTVLSVFSRSIVIEFVLGMVIAWQLPAIGRWPRAASATLLISGAALISFQPPSPDAFRGLTMGLPAAMAVAGAIGLERGGAVVRSRLALLVGDASYSLYLIHIFVVIVTLRVTARWSGGLGIGLAAGATIVAAVAAAIVLHLIFERPTIRWFRRFAGLRPSTSDLIDRPAQARG